MEVKKKRLEKTRLLQARKRKRFAPGAASEDRLEHGDDS